MIDYALLAACAIALFVCWRILRAQTVRFKLYHTMPAVHIDVGAIHQVNVGPFRFSNLLLENIDWRFTDRNQMEVKMLWVAAPNCCCVWEPALDNYSRHMCDN